MAYTCLYIDTNIALASSVQTSQGGLSVFITLNIISESWIVVGGFNSEKNQ